MNTEISFEGMELRVRHGEKDYRLSFGDEMTVELIAVSSKNGERKSYRIP